MGLGSFPTDDYQFLGMLGMHGTYEANLAMHQSDLMICIGARFDDRITGKVSGFSWQVLALTTRFVSKRKPKRTIVVPVIILKLLLVKFFI